MSKKSDNRRRERTISATEAGRSLSAVFDEVAAGATVHVVRHGIEICVIAPPVTPRRKLSEILTALKHAPKVYLDDEFGSDLQAVIDEHSKPHEFPKWD